MQFFAIFLLFISMSAIAQDTSRVSNIKCKGGWISTGTSKLEVISYCGQPKYTDVTSGANTVKTEDLLYTIKHKDYIISFRNGKVVRLGVVK